MSSEYDEMRMIVCDRKSAITKDDEGLNNEWTNEFNETVQMKPGDRLAVFNAFISEKGAGTAESIEFKDINLSGSRTIQVTKTQTLLAGDTRNNQLLVAESGRRFYSEIRTDGPTPKKIADRFKEEFMYMDYVENATENIIQKDNSTSLVINYYKTMDGLCLYQLPRRWSNENYFSIVGAKNVNPISWSVDDGLATGRCRGENVLIGSQTDILPTESPGTVEFFDIDEVYGYVLEDYKIILDFEADVPLVVGTPGTKGQVRQGRTKRLIIKNDNSRMTIMMRTKNLFHPVDVVRPPPINTELYYDYIPPYYAADPEFHDYITYRETVDLSLQPGFTSAKYVSEELTRQLRSSQIGDDDIQTIERGHTRIVDDFQAKTTTNLEKFVETSTYRRFVASNDYLGQKKFYDETLDNSNPPLFGAPEVGTHGPTTITGEFLPIQGFNPTMDFYNQYQFIATKRPDLVEAGEELNDIFGNIVDVLGGNQQQAYYTTNPIITDIPYSPENLLKLKKFIDAQANYPELFSAKNIRNVCQTNSLAVPNNLNPYYEIKEVNVAGFFTLQETSFVNINNARYLHMNQYETKLYNNLLEGDPKLNADWAKHAMLGCSYYDWRGHFITDTATGAVDNTRFSRPLNDPEESAEFTQVLAGQGGERRLNSAPFFFHYDPSQKDKLYSDTQVANQNSQNENYSYGCFGRDTDVGTIVIYPNKILDSSGAGVGLPPHFFTTNSGGVGTIETGRKVGYDRHWNAWGTATIGLTSGIPKYEYKQTYNGAAPFWDTNTQNGMTPPLVSDPVIGSTVATIQGIYSNPGIDAGDDFNNSINQFLTNVYLGADSPTVAYDGAHFSFNNLHTPLNKGNLNTITEADESFDESEIVYKINPQQQYNSWSPSMRPYEETIDFKYTDDATADNETRRRVNRNLETFQVYDTTTGIFIEDFGYNQDVWDDSLWGRLGFTYNQLHNDNPPERQKRYTDFTSTSNILTTNADVRSKDIKSWQQNKFKESQYSNTLFHAFQFKAFKAGSAKDQTCFLAFLPEIIAPTSSVSVVASDYPTQINNGFYNIRSDLALNVASVLGSGNNKYPIVGIADKTNSLKDFFISSPSSISHTITHPTTISSITTSITDPDGTASRCSPNSVIIYRITRSVDTSFNILGDLEKKLQELELQKNKK